MKVIAGFDGPTRFLSNYAPIPAAYDGVGYPTAEHAFAAAKSLDPSVREVIAQAGSPGEAKRLGGPKGVVDLRPDWDARVRFEAMREIVASKFSGDAAGLLLSTGDDLLVERTRWHDQEWGWCDCPSHRSAPGRNYLGRTLMQVRSSLRRDPASRWTRVMCTGHREQSMTPAQRAWVAVELARVARKLVDEHGMLAAIHGGAVGADLAWARAAHECGVEDLWAYLPFPQQADRWRPDQVADWTLHGSLRADGGRATRSEFLADRFSVGALHDRNYWMIRDSDAVVAVLDPAKTRAGPWRRCASWERRCR